MARLQSVDLKPIQTLCDSLQLLAWFVLDYYALTDLNGWNEYEAKEAQHIPKMSACVPSDIK